MNQASFNRPPALGHQSSFSKTSSFVDANGYPYQVVSPNPGPNRLPFTPVNGSMSSSPASYSAFHSQVASPQEPAYNQNPFGFQAAQQQSGGAFQPPAASGAFGGRQTRSQTKAKREQEPEGPPLSGGQNSWARRTSSNTRRSLNSSHVAEDVEM